MKIAGVNGVTPETRLANMNSQKLIRSCSRDDGVGDDDDDDYAYENCTKDQRELQFRTTVAKVNNIHKVK